MRKDERALRQAIIDKCRWMNASGLNQGTSGNISARYGDQMLITPSAIAYDAMQPEMLAAMPLDGDYGHWQGPLKPSTEWRFHLDIMRARPDVGAIVHTHSTFATILAIGRHEIPACHYMVAIFGGNSVRCGDYATYGTAELSKNAMKALEGRTACLLANHGMIATGSGLDKAMWAAVELETLAKQYYHARLLGNPVLLSDNEIAQVRAQFQGYGLQAKASSPPNSRPGKSRARAAKAAVSAGKA